MKNKNPISIIGGIIVAVIAYFAIFWIMVAIYNNCFLTGDTTMEQYGQVHYFIAMASAFVICAFCGAFNDNRYYWGWSIFFGPAILGEILVVCAELYGFSALILLIEVIGWSYMKMTN